MDTPMNAAYGKEEKKQKEPAKSLMDGFRIQLREIVGPISPVLLIIAVVCAFLFFMTILFTVLYLPMGLSFMATKNASGFWSYLGTFVLYLFGFFVTLVTIGSIIVVSYLEIKSLATAPKPA